MSPKTENQYLTKQQRYFIMEDFAMNLISQILHGHHMDMNIATTLNQSFNGLQIGCGILSMVIARQLSTIGIDILALEADIESLLEQGEDLEDIIRFINMKVRGASLDYTNYEYHHGSPTVTIVNATDMAYYWPLMDAPVLATDEFPGYSFAKAMAGSVEIKSIIEAHVGDGAIIRPRPATKASGDLRTLTGNGDINKTNNSLAMHYMFEEQYPNNGTPDWAKRYGGAKWSEEAYKRYNGIMMSKVVQGDDVGFLYSPTEEPLVIRHLEILNNRLYVHLKPEIGAFISNANLTATGIPTNDPYDFLKYGVVYDVNYKNLLGMRPTHSYLLRLAMSNGPNLELIRVLAASRSIVLTAGGNMLMQATAEHMYDLAYQEIKTQGLFKMIPTDNNLLLQEIESLQMPDMQDEQYKTSFKYELPEGGQGTNNLLSFAQQAEVDAGQVRQIIKLYDVTQNDSAWAIHRINAETLGCYNKPKKEEVSIF